MEFKAKGENIKLPAELPAAYMLKVVELNSRYDSQEDIKENELIKISLELFNKEQLDLLFEKGLSVNELSDIILWLQQYYQEKPEPTEEEKTNDDEKN